MKLLKKIIKNTLVLLIKIADDIIFISGIVLLSIGVFKVYLPAGYIVLGICFIAFAFFIARKSAEGR